MDLLDVAVLHFEGIFFFPRVVERLDLKNVSVLMVDFFFLSCVVSLLLLGAQGGRSLHGDGYGMPDRL